MPLPLPPLKEAQNHPVAALLPLTHSSYPPRQIARGNRILRLGFPPHDVDMACLSPNLRRIFCKSYLPTHSRKYEVHLDVSKAAKATA